jgi:hypothetical protein
MEISSFVIMLIEYCVEIGIWKVILKERHYFPSEKNENVFEKWKEVSKSNGVSSTRRTSVP